MDHLKKPWKFFLYKKTNIKTGIAKVTSILLRIEIAKNIPDKNNPLFLESWQKNALDIKKKIAAGTSPNGKYHCHL